MPANGFAAVILTSSLACGVTTIGIYVISKYERWGREHSAYFMSFAAGVLISVSFVHIIPKSFEMNSTAPVFLLVGFLVIYLSNRLLNLYVLAAIGMVLHEFPEGIVTFVLLERGGFSRRKSAVYAFLAAAISTPLGTLVSYPFINNIEQSTLGILLAISAGALVYVGASHLLPAVERENKKYSILAMAAGVLVAVFIVMSKG
jgi:zinc transporter ZupT